MTESSLDPQIEQTARIVRRLVRLRPRFKMQIPERLVRVKARLDELYPEGRTRNPGDYDLLYQIGVALSQYPEAPTMGELSRALDVPLSTATRIVDWLVRAGYVERLHDPEDRRVVRVALTRTGRELVKLGDKLVRERVERILCVFSADERDTLIRLLDKLVTAMEDEGE